MKLVVISHKETWRDTASPSGYSTVGGFPFQMQAISSLFDQTSLMIPIQSTPVPAGAIPLNGHNLRIVPLVEPAWLGWRRKLAMIPWLLNHIALLLREVRRADAVHTPVGGDIGTIGIFIALAQRKPLFVWHCGTWDDPISTVDRLTQRGLESIAGGRNVVLATGGAESPPSASLLILPDMNVTGVYSTSCNGQAYENSSGHFFPDWCRIWLYSTTLRPENEPGNPEVITCKRQSH